MNRRHRFCNAVLFCLLLPGPTLAQGTIADYQRAAAVREKLQGLAVNMPEKASWIEGTSRFWYRKPVKGGNQFVLVAAIGRRDGHERGSGVHHAGRQRPDQGQQDLRAACTSRTGALGGRRLRGAETIRFFRPPPAFGGTPRLEQDRKE